MSDVLFKNDDEYNEIMNCIFQVLTKILGKNKIKQSFKSV